MLNPDEILHISEGAEEIAETLHQEITKRIIERIMVRIGRGDDYLLTPMDKWQLEVLQDSGQLLEEVQKEIAQKTKLQEKEVKEAFESAGINALDYDNRVYQAAGLSPVSLQQSPPLVRLMQRNYEATMGEWRNFTRTTATAAQQSFIQACDKAYHLTASGTISYSQAVKEAINDIASTGVEVVYKNPKTGKERRDTIETATLRAVRTGVSQATGAIQMKRLEEMDWDIILTSAHLGARTGDGGQNPGNHLWWQGQFFSRTGRTPGLPLFVEATGYGTVEGICGVNCRHSFGPGDGENNPFADILKEDNYKVEKLQQRQRLLERRIRKTKREVMAWKAAVDSATDERVKFENDLVYQKKAALLQKQNKEYEQFCKANNLKKLNDRIQIAKWDRQQAAAARGAAKRYENALESGLKQDIIKQRISSGEYSLKLSKQQYLKHVEGTRQFDDYRNARAARGQEPQGKLFLSEDEAQNFINKYSGKGIPKLNRKGEVLQVEFVSGENAMGQYFKDGKWNNTKRAAIHYGKKGSHVVPVEENND